MRPFAKRHSACSVSTWLCRAASQPCATRLCSTDASAHSGTDDGVEGKRERSHYRRRTSDPQTLRQRGNFQRDLKFGKRRPLPDAPWRQIKAKTYLDDAERLYGRKEHWHLVEDSVLREKLVTVLQDYVRDTISAIRLEARDAMKYRHLCDMATREYRAHIVAGAYSSPEMLRTWAQRLHSSGASSASPLRDANAADHATDADSLPSHSEHSSDKQGSDDSTSARHTASDTEDTAWREARHRRGREAVVEGTPAMSDLPRSDAHGPALSAFPFLRQRAVEDEHSLDPSLVDWTAKFFPEDTAATFRAPPTLRQRTTTTSDSVDGEVYDEVGSSDHERGGSTAEHSRARGGTGTKSHTFAGQPRAHARHRLQSSLRAHNDRNRATFDAEGVFFHVRRQTEESERAPKPKPVRGSDENFAENAAGVVKVPWGVVSAAKRRGYSTDTLRAKERLVRLSRGEDPETIP